MEQENTVPILRRNDRHDADRAELLLIRAGHHLWLQRTKVLLVSITEDVRAFDEALETVWAAKRLVRFELKRKRVVSAKRLRDYFQAKRTAKEMPVAA